ncbi:MAG TPA: hypothetical protein VFG59_06620 [Anaeromyxobacter sp.]|nr:hypothetical protein [Anaeromyxobacter sp.]
MSHSKQSHDQSLEGPGADARDVLELWMSLSRWEWKSLVLVPADAESSAAPLARLLANVAQHLSFGPVTAISVDRLEYGSALALADLQQHLDAQRTAVGPVVEARPAVEGDPVVVPEGPQTEAIMRLPPARLIISIPPVVREPLGIPAAREADAVIVCLRLGWSRLPDVRRTVELIGREKITGTVLLR